MCVYLCVCVCVCEREREREKGGPIERLTAERDRQTETERASECVCRWRGGGILLTYLPVQRSGCLDLTSHCHHQKDATSK